MNCRSCNYPLWNLAARQCPECGQAFKPSEFEFTPGSVRFLCPVCSKAYYGTAATGHLVPRSFTCVGCSSTIDMDEMVLTPALGVTDEQTTPIELPWSKRRETGRLRSFVRTCLWGMGRPADIGRSLPATGTAKSAWWFLVLTQTLVWMCQIGGIFIVPFAFAPGGSGLGILTGLLISVIVFVAFTALLAVPIWALLSHVILRATGSTRGGADLTLSSICFTSGANLPTGIPFFGYLFGPVWWLISSVIAVKESQRVSGGRASLAILPVPIIGALVLIGGYIGFVSWAIGMAGRAATMAATSTATAGQATTLMNALQAQARRQTSTGSPVVIDPIAALNDGLLQPGDLILADSLTTSDTWTVSGVALDDLPFLSADELRQMTDRLAALPPPGPAGERRLGDAVFYTAGIDLASPPPAPRWVVVLWPDPAVNPEQPAWSIAVLHSDGTVASHPAAGFDLPLAMENARRVQAGLPPLPHPRDVK